MCGCEGNKMTYAFVNIGMSLLIGIIFILAALILQKIHQQILTQYTDIEQSDQ